MTRCTKAPTTMEAIARNRFRDIEPEVRSVVRYIYRLHKGGIMSSVWSCGGGHASLGIPDVGEPWHSGPPRPRVLVVARDDADVAAGVGAVATRFTGPLSVARVVITGATTREILAPGLAVAGRRPRTWMIMFESAAAAKPARWNLSLYDAEET